mmetsp:Transcript_39224/g.68442  ORF Transcript_39224/g.68442 Transcript_39224/m.68442 type:complete len:95 (+) Transcript_39224:397-681(+)
MLAPVILHIHHTLLLVLPTESALVLTFMIKNRVLSTPNILTSFTLQIQHALLFVLPTEEPPGLAFEVEARKLIATFRETHSVFVCHINHALFFV